MYEGMLAETVGFKGYNGDPIEGYLARPLGAGPYPGVIVIHHLPGWDEATKEMTRKLAYHGLCGPFAPSPPSGGAGQCRGDLHKGSRCWHGT